MQRPADVPGSPKSGLFTIAIGIALVVVQLLPQGMRHEPVAFGLLFLFGGVALLIYDQIAKRQV
jgi:hypothetical protein